jgi:hypothetical protein
MQYYEISIRLLIKSNFKDACFAKNVTLPSPSPGIKAIQFMRKGEMARPTFSGCSGK